MKMFYSPVSVFEHCLTYLNARIRHLSGYDRTRRLRYQTGVEAEMVRLRTRLHQQNKVHTWAVIRQWFYSLAYFCVFNAPVDIYRWRPVFFHPLRKSQPVSSKNSVLLKVCYWFTLLAVLLHLLHLRFHLS